MINCENAAVLTGPDSANFFLAFMAILPNEIRGGSAFSSSSQTKPQIREFSDIGCATKPQQLIFAVTQHSDIPSDNRSPFYMVHTRHECSHYYIQVQIEALQLCVVVRITASFCGASHFEEVEVEEKGPWGKYEGGMENKLLEN